MPVDSARRFDSPYQATPRTHLLSNGNYAVMLTAAGSGFSRWRDMALTRWREDPTCDPWGFYIFLRDVFNGHVWSAGYQPIGRESELYEAAFFEDRAEFRRKDGPIRSFIEDVRADGVRRGARRAAGDAQAAGARPRPAVAGALQFARGRSHRQPAI